MSRHATEITVPAVNQSSFEVPFWVHHLGGFIERNPRLWIRLANFETRCLAERLAATRIDRPIYITGLARSGTTILLEVIASHRGMGTHRYSDFPPVFTPYAWNWWLCHMRLAQPNPVERAHGDGIYVTPNSPEAMEEVIWMAFFPHLHDPARNNVLDGTVGNEQFDGFYSDHIRKVLLARDACRYVSKENYNIARLEYLQRLFPDARFVIPIRHPYSHIASLIKEHRLFTEAHRRHSRALTHFRRVGHFEFGADMRPINVGDEARVRDILELWKDGCEVRGWARYWAMIYGFVADRLDARSTLRDSCLVIRFEDVCQKPAIVLEELCRHCGLDESGFVEKNAPRLRAPDYYTARYSTEDQRAIDEETVQVRRQFGYD